LLLPEGQTGKAWEPSKKQCFLENQGKLDGNELLLYIRYGRRAKINGKFQNVITVLHGKA
jgi:hypothetical protein